MPRYIPKAEKRINPRIEKFVFFPRHFDWAFSATHFLYWRIFTSAFDGLKAQFLCTVLLVFILSAPASGLLIAIDYLIDAELNEWIGIPIILIIYLAAPVILIHLRFGVEAKKKRSIKQAASDWSKSKVKMLFAFFAIHILAILSWFLMMSIFAAHERI